MIHVKTVALLAGAAPCCALAPHAGRAQEAPQPRLPTIAADRGHAPDPGRTGGHAPAADDRHDAAAHDGQQRRHAVRLRRSRPAHCFWMRNTLLPLSIAFVDDDGRIVNIWPTCSRWTKTSHCSAAAGALRARDEPGLVRQARHEGRRAAARRAVRPRSVARVCAGYASGEVRFGEVPVDQLVEEGLDELRAQVAVVDVVGVLPHVDRQQRLVGGGQRRAGGAGVDDVDAAVGLLHQPGPARAEVADRRLDEGLLEGGVAAPLGLDRRGQRALGLAAAAGLHAVPEEGVVPDLRGVVVDAAAGLPDDVLQRHRLELGALLQVVEVHDVGVVVLAVVVLERLAAVVRGQRVERVRQGGQGVFHRGPLVGGRCCDSRQSRRDLVAAVTRCAASSAPRCAPAARRGRRPRRPAPRRPAAGRRPRSPAGRRRPRPRHNPAPARACGSSACSRWRLSRPAAAVLQTQRAGRGMLQRARRAAAAHVGQRRGAARRPACSRVRQRAAGAAAGAARPRAGRRQAQRQRGPAAAPASAGARATLRCSAPARACRSASSIAARRRGQLGRGGRASARAGRPPGRTA